MSVVPVVATAGQAGITADNNLTFVQSNILLFANGSANGPPPFGPGGGAHDNGSITHDIFQDVFYIVLTPAVSLFGCVGNILNIIALVRSRQKMKKADGGRDSGTLLGLMVLAVSDMLFCATVFPRAFAKIGGNEAVFEPNDFRVYYQVYGTGFLNTFLLTSTWITVAMATMRYIGICHPLATRKIDSAACVRCTYIMIVVICVVVNIPIFYQFKIDDIEIEGHVYYLIDIGEFSIDSQRGYVFLWFRAFIGIFSPAGLLTFCNCSLIMALRRSRRMRRECRVQNSAAASRASNRITLLLIIIVILFVVLVFPAELMDFFLAVTQSDPDRTYTFMVIRCVANFLQVVNGSCNFVLYCALNVHFRKTMKELLTCKTRPFSSQRRGSLTSSASRTDRTKQVWL